MVAHMAYLNGVNQMSSKTNQVERCSHCTYPISIRNPSGYCDHLYYPECCVTCKCRKLCVEIDELIGVKRCNNLH